MLKIPSAQVDVQHDGGDTDQAFHRGKLNVAITGTKSQKLCSQVYLCGQTLPRDFCGNHLGISLTVLLSGTFVFLFRCHGWLCPGELAQRGQLAYNS